LLEVHCENVEGLPIRILGIHLDDRSEMGRLNEIASVVDVINSNPGIHTLLLGDFNAMRRESFFARFARSSSVRLVIQRVRHELVRSMAERVAEMALGTTIEYIETHTHLHDMDPAKKRTISSKQAGLEWAPSWRLAKIDWIFGSKHFSTRSYQVLPDVGSDHRPVVATLETVS
jgi:endonuclease/exonuclease/phosphatase family metal-dependent hydrolase